MEKTLDMYGHEIKAGDIVESLSRHKHKVVNKTCNLIMFQEPSGDMAYRPARKYRKVDNEE